jgi:hypothetical protein
MSAPGALPRRCRASTARRRWRRKCRGPRSPSRRRHCKRNTSCPCRRWWCRCWCRLGSRGWAAFAHAAPRRGPGGARVRAWIANWGGGASILQNCACDEGTADAATSSASSAIFISLGRRLPGCAHPLRLPIHIAVGVGGLNSVLSAHSAGSRAPWVSGRPSQFSIRSFRVRCTLICVFARVQSRAHIRHPSSAGYGAPVGKWGWSGAVCASACEPEGAAGEAGRGGQVARL